MSSLELAASERVCYVHCNFCNTILAVSVPSSSLYTVVTVRCGHCSNLLSVNMGASLQTLPLHHHYPHQSQKLHLISEDMSSSGAKLDKDCKDSSSSGSGSGFGSGSASGCSSSKSNKVVVSTTSFDSIDLVEPPRMPPIRQARSAAEAKKRNGGVYIVYMGSSVSANGSLKNDHTLLLNSILQRKKNAIIHKYSHGFSGFAARLSAAEAQSIAKKPGVVSVFPDPILQLHTTRSWDFLKYETGVVIDSNPSSDLSGSSAKGSGAIIGILDTGIWPESDSFKDNDMDEIPPEWKGTCVKGRHFNSSNCNKKIIGARFYTREDEDNDEDLNTPRDFFGHGTHVASTAAGAAVPNVSYYGLAEGTGKGGSPHSRIAVYRICEPRGCPGSNILAGISDAIADGVDILSLSVGSRSAEDYKTDPIAIGAFHAVQNGITVVCSAGNSGPNPNTVVNGAPWILTVAATTIDRDFESDVVLGAGKEVIKGEAINFANIGESPVHPLIYAKSAKNSNVGDGSARNCDLDSLDGDKIKGKIVLCESVDDYVSGSLKKDEVQNKGGIGLILVNDMERGEASNYLEFPMTVISSKDAADIFSYINSTENPVATILPTKTVPNFKPAPIMASFSSRGPSTLTKNILKPDVAAPGVNILAAWVANDTDTTLRDKDPPQFNVISGTSMSCPHVSGMAATIKSQNPEWSPSAIKSAIMTTTSQMNNLKGPITTEIGAIATPYDYGAGEVSTSGALQPGLVYETTTLDYLNFLCYYGYNTSTIALVSKTVPKDFYCPEESSSDLISNINYPSIAVFFSQTGKQQTRNITRTVTNVASDGHTTYNVILDAPKGVNVDVIPDKLQFTKIGQRLSFQVIFSVAKSSLNRDVFGSITWTNGKSRVRSPFVVGSK